MKKYSEFINFPIYLWSTKEVDVEVPADEDETSEEEDSCRSLVKFFFPDMVVVCVWMLMHHVFLNSPRNYRRRDRRR